MNAKAKNGQINHGNRIPKKYIPYSHIPEAFNDWLHGKNWEDFEQCNARKAEVIRNLVAQGENPWDYGLLLDIEGGGNAEVERSQCHSTKEATELWLNCAAELEGDNSSPYTAEDKKPQKETGAARAKASSSSPSMSM